MSIDWDAELKKIQENISLNDSKTQQAIDLLNEAKTKYQTGVAIPATIFLQAYGDTLHIIHTQNGIMETVVLCYEQSERARKVKFVAMVTVGLLCVVGTVCYLTKMERHASKLVTE